MDIRSALRQGISTLRGAGVPSYTLAAELLLLDSIGRDRAWIYAHPEDEVPAEQWARFLSLVARRAKGEPTQYLTGKREFWGLEFLVTPDVLIPRPETELVVEVALDRLALGQLRAGRANRTDGHGLWIADIGTGSGCIAIALAKQLRLAEILATDISSRAIAVARQNARRHGVTERVRFVEANLFEGSREWPAKSGEPGAAFDLIVSNPPYVGLREAETLPREVREHEPDLALYGGEEGYELYRELIRQSGRRLKPGGGLVVELGHNSLPAVRPLFDSPEWTEVGVSQDLAGLPRVVAAKRR